MVFLDAEKREEFIEFVYTMHLQNTSGRETSDEMFREGIKAAYDELIGFKDVEIEMPKKGKYVLIRTQFCKYPTIVGYFNGVKWISTNSEEVLNVRWWRDIF